MNAADSTTPADQLVGTNIPEFHKATASALQQIYTAHPARVGSITIWREKKNRRNFRVESSRVKCEAGWEKIVTFRPGAALKKDRPTWEAFRNAAQSAASHALGYYWSAMVVIKYRDSGAIGSGRFANGRPIFLHVTPHSAGLSR